MEQGLKAVRLILAMAVWMGTFASNNVAVPADQASPSDKLKNLEFREIGPATMGGRIDDFAVVESNPNIVYVGVASGGVWKTTNNGTTWEPVFDKESVSTIEAAAWTMAVLEGDPSLPDKILPPFRRLLEKARKTA